VVLIGLTDNFVGSLVVISPLAELEVVNGYFEGDHVTSAVAGSGTLTLSGDSYTQVYSDDFDFSGALQIQGSEVEFEPHTDPVTVHSFTIDSGADFMSAVTIQADSMNMNGGTTDADVVVSHHYGWTAGELAGSGGSTITIDPGINLDVTGPALKRLNTRDLVIGGAASMSGSGEFAMTGGASVIMNPSGLLAVGDSVRITGIGDSLINHGQLTFNCPNDTAMVGVFLYNQTTTRTPGTIDILSGQVVMGAVDNAGTMNVNGGAALNMSGDVHNSGEMTFNDGSVGTVTGTLDNGSGGTSHIYGGAELDGSGVVNNEGHVDRLGGARRTSTQSVIRLVFNNLQGTGLLEIISDTLTLTSGGCNAGDVFIHAGAVLRIEGTFENQVSGLIRGGGTLDISSATSTNNGTIAPGASPGTLNIAGALNTPGTILIEVAGLTPGTEYDRLLIGGNANLGGTLQLSRLNGLIPTLTDTFHCITYPSRSGEFAQVTGTPVGNGTYMEIAYRPTEIVQYVCDGVSEIDMSVTSISDTIEGNMSDTLELDICNEGHCPLEWTTEWVPFDPCMSDSCPHWAEVLEGEAGLITRGECSPIRVVLSTAATPFGTYNGEIRITSNDPDDPVTTIPVQVVQSLTSFDIGGGNNDFPDFISAVNYLTTNGVAAPTRFNVYPGTYAGAVTIPAISGASAENTVTFQAAAGRPLLRTTPVDTILLTLYGADHVVFDGIDFTADSTS
jgi:hypothetical protein